MDRIAAEKKLAPMISGEYFNVRKSFEFVWIANKSGDPCGGCFKAIRAAPLRVVFLFYANPSLMYPWLGLYIKQKSRQPDGCRDCSDGFGGERGIRTPGPPIGGQRFSRPPHSTALPFLHKIMNF